MTTPWYTGPAPDEHVAGDLLFRRLTATHARLDHDALMASLGYLRMWSASEWPQDGFTIAENRDDLARHDREHEARIAFTYSVQDLTGDRVLGCLYVRPYRDMLRTRGVETPAEPFGPGVDHGPVRETPCARGWVRRDEPEATERAFLTAALGWLTGPQWEFPELWWTANQADAWQLAQLDALGWTRTHRVAAAGESSAVPVGGAAPDTTWVFRAPQPRPSS